MKGKSLLLFLGLLKSWVCIAQHNAINKKQCVMEYDSTLKESVYTYVDRMPEFGKGEISLADYFTRNFHYPEEQLNPQGSIWLVFIVDEKGKVQKQTVFNKRKEEFTSIDREALRILSVMPAWRPGTCNGIKVPVRVLWPIRF